MRSTIGFSMGVITIAVSIALSAFFVFKHAVSKRKYVQVNVGMKENEVIDILGQPSYVQIYEPDKNQYPQLQARYYYGGFRQWRFCVVEIYFDREGKVFNKVHDH